MEPDGDTIYHLALVDDWVAAGDSGRYERTGGQPWNEQDLLGGDGSPNWSSSVAEPATVDDQIEG